MSAVFYATMTNATAEHEFELTSTRAGNSHIVEALRKVHPELLVDEKGLYYPTATLTSAQAVALLESWKIDIDSVVACEHDEDATPVADGAFYAGFDDGLCHALQSRIGDMLTLARSGYGVTFKAL